MHLLTTPVDVPIGPGRLVLVVGPSGSGKDSLIRAAHAHLAGDDGFVFPRRTITRPPSSSEDNEACGPDAFARIEAEGGFAISWSAHGHRYAIPASIHADIRQDRTVICNVSRTVVPDTRIRYRHVIAVEVTAPPWVLAERLAGRARADDGDLRLRLDRAAEVDLAEPKVTISNAGSLDSALAEFLALLSGRSPRDVQL